MPLIACRHSVLQCLGMWALQSPVVTRHQQFPLRCAERLNQRWWPALLGAFPFGVR